MSCIVNKTPHKIIEILIYKQYRNLHCDHKQFAVKMTKD